MISVVIPTHDRGASVCRTLEALARQEGAGDFEVIVVADGCTDDTAERVRACRPSYPLTLVEQPASGANEARMRGADLARGELLVFLDDDVEPAPGCLAGHARAHREHETALVVGANPPALEQATGLFAQGLRKWWVDLFRLLGTPGYRKSYRDVLTGNMSIARALFRGLGGFDPAFRGAAEDWEFGLRAIRSGVRIVYAPDAASCHHEDPDLERYFRRVRNEGKADVQLARMYPELTQSLMLAASLGGGFVKRALRALAFKPGWMAAPLVAALRAQMRTAERLRMRRSWRKAFAHMRLYCYWRGVAEQAGSRDAVRALVAAGAPEPVRPLRVDIRPGLGYAIATVDAARPAALEVVYGERHLGWVPAVPGAEPLRGAQLQAAVLGHLSGAVAAMLGGERALPPSQALLLERSA